LLQELLQEQYISLLLILHKQSDNGKTFSKVPFAIIRPKLPVLPRVLREQPTLELL
jgi:hypothetical protein